MEVQEQEVTERYVSCRNGQKINGRVYNMDDVIPGASNLPTLPALLRTNRVRLKGFVVTGENENGEELGSAEVAPDASKNDEPEVEASAETSEENLTPAQKRARTIARKKAEADAARAENAQK